MTKPEFVIAPSGLSGRSRPLAPPDATAETAATPSDKIFSALRCGAIVSQDDVSTGSSGQAGADDGGGRYALFSRARISLPVLKNGTDFCSTNTYAPVRGLRPARARRRLTENAPNPRNSTRSSRASAAVISPAPR